MIRASLTALFRVAILTVLATTVVGSSKPAWAQSPSPSPQPVQTAFTWNGVTPTNNGSPSLSPLKISGTCTWNPQGGTSLNNGSITINPAPTGNQNLQVTINPTTGTMTLTGTVNWNPALPTGTAVTITLTGTGPNGASTSQTINITAP